MKYILLLYHYISLDHAPVPLFDKKTLVNYVYG